MHRHIFLALALLAPALARADAVPVPTLDWGACPPAAAGAASTDGLQGAMARVPLDYAEPSGPTFSLALINAPAHDPAARIGTLEPRRAWRRRDGLLAGSDRRLPCGGARPLRWCGDAVCMGRGAGEDLSLGTFLRIGSDFGAAAAIGPFTDQCGAVDAAGCAFSAGSPEATRKKWERPPEARVRRRHRRRSDHGPARPPVHCRRPHLFGLADSGL